MKKRTCILGAHFSISGGLHEALYEAKRYDCPALQMFTRTSRSWRERIVSDKEIEVFKKARQETGIKDIAAHASYLINLAAPDSENHFLSRKALEQELIRSSALEIPFVVLHPGSHLGNGEKKGIDRISESINGIFEKNQEIKTRLLLETTSGQGSGIGHSFEQLHAIIEKINRKDKTGVCLDTCHIFAAGYDIRTEESYLETTDLFDKIIGFEKLFLIHLNDSKKGLGSHIDRHEHIGKGEIGIDAFRLIMNDKHLAGIPKIIETPKTGGGKDWDRINLRKLRLMTL
ncbi:MAG: deoxyribonuclease IV [Desulfobacteraceae bacterium]|nr:MAG: deoxyribonuclease IV [Desulfobacteraceae bacterium]